MEKFKKILRTVLILSVIVGVVCIATSCDVIGGIFGGHTHNLTIVEKIDATCTEAGQEAYFKCDGCDQLFADIEGKNAIEAPVAIAPLGHKIVGVAGTEPTCTEPGIADCFKCSRCEAVFEDAKGENKIEAPVTSAPLGHSLVKTSAKAATCTADGNNEYYTCSVCKKVYKDADAKTETTVAAEIIKASGHAEVKHDAKAPTCTEKGWDAYVTCKNCDYTTYAEKAALGHDEISHDAKAPTCTEKGWDAYVTCKNCDYTTYAEKAALGHDEISHDAKAPTCTEIGWDAYVTCKNCDYTTYVEKAALGHKLTKTEAKDATCLEDGNVAYWTCSSVCKQIFSDAEGNNVITNTVIPAKGHTLSETLIVEGAVKNYEPGSNFDASNLVVKLDCKDCDYTKEVTGYTLSKTENLQPSDNAVVVTYVEDGKTYTASIAIVVVHVHITGDLVPAEAPNCTETGTLAYYECEICKHKFADKDATELYESVVVPALGHDEISHDAKAPTCTDIGWDAYVTCKNCDYTTYVEKAALGHSTSKVDAKAPTCTEDGYEAYYTCSGCDKLFSDADAKNIIPAPIVVGALGHDEISHDAKAPTCTDIGWDAYVTCKNCDYTTYAEKAALGHDATKTEAKESSCTEAGNNAYWTCSVCGKVYSDEACTVETSVEAETLPLAKHETNLLSDANGHWYDCANCDYVTDKENHSGIAYPDAAPKCTVCDTEFGKASWDGWVLFRPGIVEVAGGSVTSASHVTVNGIMASQYVFGAGSAGSDTTIWTMSDASDYNNGMYQVRIPTVGDNERYIYLYVSNDGDTDISFRIYSENYGDKGGVDVTLAAGESGWFKYSVHTGTTIGSNVNLKLLSDLASETTVTIYGYWHLETEEIANLDIANRSEIKLSYRAGEKFSLPELILVSNIFSNNENDLLNNGGAVEKYYIASNFTVSGLEIGQTLEAGNYTVTVSFGGKSVELQIIVSSHTHAPQLVAKKPATCTEDGYEAYYICNVDGCGQLFADAEGNTPISSITTLPAGHVESAAIPGHKASCPRCGAESGEVLDPDGWVHFAPGVVWSDYYEGIYGTVDGSSYIDYEIGNYEGGILATKFTFAAGTPANASTAFWNDQNLAQNIKVPVRQDGTRVIAVITNHGTEDITITFGQVDSSSDKGSGTILVPAGRTAAVEYKVTSGAAQGNNGWIAVRNNVETETVVTVYGYFCVEDDIASLEIKTPAEKLSFSAGDTFTAEGLRLAIASKVEGATANYGETEIYSNFSTDFDGYVFTAKDSGTKTVTVSFGGATVTYEITVLDHAHKAVEHAGVNAVKCESDGYETYYSCSVAGCDKIFSDAECQNEISAPVVIKAHNESTTIPGQEVVCPECGKATGEIRDPDGWIHFAPGVVWSDYYEAIEGTVDGSSYIDYEIENYEGDILATKFTFAAGTPANASTAFWNDKDFAHNIKVPLRDGGTRVIAVITNHGTEDITITIGQVDNAKDTGSGTVLVPAGKSAVVEYKITSGADLGNNGWIAVRNDVATETVVTMYGYFCAEQDAEDLVITTPATKTTFQVGDTFTAEGLRLKLSPDNAASGAYYGQTEVYSNYTTNFDGYTFTAEDVGTKIVTVSFAGATVTYEITVE